MKSRAVLYVPSDTPEAMVLATKRVAGVPLILRGVMTLAQAGIRDITLLLASAGRPTIERFLARYPRAVLPRVDILTYDEPHCMSPRLLLALSERVEQRFFLINANLLFDPEFVRALTAPSVHGREMLLCQQGADPLPFVELTRPALESLLPFASEKPRSIESCLSELTATLQQRIVQKPLSAHTFLLTALCDRPGAEKFLTEGIRLATTGPVARFLNKRLSLPLSLLLTKLWVSPNTITMCNMCIGLLAAVFAADGHQYGVIFLGASLYQLASIIDGCDGEVAKLTFRGSRFGQLIDTVSDNVSLAGIMIAMMAGSWRATHAPIAFWVGGIMLLAAAATLITMLRAIRTRTDSKSLVAYEQEYLARLPAGKYRWLLGFIGWAKYIVKKDGFSLAIFLFALAGHLYGMLWLTAAGAVISATAVSTLALGERWRLSQEPQTLAVKAVAERSP